jgi:hypothetical protein
VFDEFGVEILPESDLRSPDRHIWIITTARWVRSILCKTLGYPAKL